MEGIKAVQTHRLMGHMEYGVKYQAALLLAVQESGIHWGFIKAEIML